VDLGQVFRHIFLRIYIFKTTGTDIEKILPPMRRFGGSNRNERKQTIIERIMKFFEKYFGIV